MVPCSIHVSVCISFCWSCVNKKYLHISAFLICEYCAYEHLFNHAFLLRYNQTGTDRKEDRYCASILNKARGFIICCYCS